MLKEVRGVVPNGALQMGAPLLRGPEPLKGGGDVFEHLPRVTFARQHPNEVIASPGLEAVTKTFHLERVLVGNVACARVHYVPHGLDGRGLGGRDRANESVGRRDAPVKVHVANHPRSKKPKLRNEQVAPVPSSEVPGVEDIARQTLQNYRVKVHFCLGGRSQAPPQWRRRSSNFPGSAGAARKML